VKPLARGHPLHPCPQTPCLDVGRLGAESDGAALFDELLDRKEVVAEGRDVLDGLDVDAGLVVVEVSLIGACG